MWDQTFSQLICLPTVHTVVAHIFLIQHSSIVFKQEVTGGKGPDCILEMLANVNLPKDLEMIAFKGRVAVRTICFIRRVLLSVSE